MDPSTIDTSTIDSSSLSSSTSSTSSMSSSSTGVPSSSSTEAPPSSSSSSSSPSSSKSSSSALPPSTSTPPPSSSTSSSSRSSTSPSPSSGTTSLSSSSSEPTTTLSPSTTFSTLVFIPTTDSRGSRTSTAPPIITSTTTSTNSNGALTTVTHVISNPTLSSSNVGSKGNTFFRNTGAVAGVFILVGLAAASIILWIFFGVRRRRHTRRLEHDTAVSATLTAVHRTPLDDDDDPVANANRSRYGSPLVDPFNPQRRSSSGLAMSSVPSASRVSAADQDNVDAYQHAPFTNYVVLPGTWEGYTSPPSAFLNGPHRDRSSSSGLEEMGAGGHYHRASDSYEPLLRRSLGSLPSPSLPNPNSIIPSARYSLAYSSNGHQNTSSGEPLVDVSGTSSVYSTDNTQDDRLDPGLRQRLQDDGNPVQELRDEEDYSRPVLGVRNLPDANSQVSFP